MKLRRCLPVVVALVACGVGLAASDDYPESSDSFSGEYRGQRTLADGTVEPLFAQVMDLGGDRYRVRLVSSLDSTDWRTYAFLDGGGSDLQARFGPGLGVGARDVVKTLDYGVVVGTSLWEGEIASGKYTGKFAGIETGDFKLEAFTRTSPTLGQKPKKGAVVIQGAETGLSHWMAEDGGRTKWLAVGDGVIQVGPKAGRIVSKEQFGDYMLHLEFRTPLMAESRGQHRGNSGVYTQGRYEVQVLDSFGEDPAWDYCGGIYKVSNPSVNMCLPPTHWQTYDIEFTAPRFDSEGKKTANARISVKHNGVLIHDDIELPGPTGGALGAGEVALGPLVLQDHGNPVQYRNIWALRK